MLDISNVIAIDVGNGRTCYFSRKGSKENSGSFSSLVVRSNEASFGGVNQGRFKTKKGEGYIVGDVCRNLDVPSRSTDTSFYTSNNYRVLLLRALELAESPKNPILCLGLPTEFFESLRDPVRQNVNKWLHEEGYFPEKIYLSRQHFGPFFDPDLIGPDGLHVPMEKRFKGRWGTIDMGHGTTDSGEFVDGSPKISGTNGVQTGFGESKGASDIHKAVLTYLSNSDGALARAKVVPKDFILDSETTENTVDIWFHQGYFNYRGEQVDIFKLALPQREQFIRETVSRVINKTWGNINFLNGLVVAGGTVAILKRELLEKYIKVPLYIPKDPCMSVVKGLHNMAVEKLKVS